MIMTGTIEFGGDGDRLDEHLRFVGSTDGCVADGRSVRCAVGELAAGASVDRSFEVAVVELPGPGRTELGR